MPGPLPPADDLDGLLRRGMHRRRALGVILGAGVVGAAACSSNSSTAGRTSSTSADRSSLGSTSTSSPDAACETAIPEETAGPFPGDGSNGPDALGLDGVVREDIRSSFADAAGTADGLDLTIKLQVMDVDAGCDPLVGAAVYAWHCDRDGGYSMYSPGLEDQNYLRGVAITDAGGTASFTSIFPGCYPGRWPHVHFEIYENESAATGGGSPIATSQLAFPKPTCELAYATSGYAASTRNLARLSLSADNVFGDDGGVHQIASMAGDVDRGLAAYLSVPITG